MVYLKNFSLLNENKEYEMISHRMYIHNNFYPLKIFPKKGLEEINFDNITIFYGGNGSGKTTILNIIANAIGASKRNINKSNLLFSEYVRGCNYILHRKEELKEIKYISSDDVFDYLLDLRAMNSNINRRKDELVKEYYEYKEKDFSNYSSLLDKYDELRNKVDTNRMTVSKYVRTRLKNNNIIQESNGETALDFWQRQIEDNAIYIIDEPENSLSAQNQLKLKQFIEESARFFNCQFIIATHSPFLLSLAYAKIYDLDSTPVKNKKWTELENVKVYYNFFMDNQKEFM